MMPTDALDMNDSRDVLKRELEDEEYRYAYAEDFLNTWVATQIVALREQRGMSQTELGNKIGTKQPGVSRLENVNHSTWKTETLKRIARALGVRLRISFETFGTLLDEDACFGRQYLMRPEFKDDAGLLDRRTPGIAIASTPIPTGDLIATTRGQYQSEPPTASNVIHFPSSPSVPSATGVDYAIAKSS